MSSPGIENYAFTAKKRWRKSVWREIARRTNNKRKKLVLYLAGEQDLDRQEAVKNGFSPHNLIAIEIDSARCKALRRKGVTTINGNLMDVMYNWPVKHKVGVVVADFCFGFEGGSLDIYDAMQCDALKDACVLINFQRGRDSATNAPRKVMSEIGFIKAAKQAFKFQVSEKHRALNYLCFHALEQAAVLRGRGHVSGDPGVVDLGAWRETETIMLAAQILNSAQATCRTYRSGKALRMDSAVFNHPLSRVHLKIGDMRARHVPIDKKMQRKITAALAVRTMRAAA